MNKTFIYHIVYETTCIVNGKKYIGCHQTNTLDDGYMGSGTHFRRAFKLYGRDAFTRTILGIFSTPKEMFEFEKELVTESFVESPSTYNLVPGGLGGFKVIDLDDWKKKLKESSSKRKNNQPYLGKKHSTETKRKISDSSKGRIPWNKGKPGTWLGRKHTEESKQKMAETTQGMYKGDKNPMYGRSAVKGRKWFHNGEETFYLFPNDDRIAEQNLIPGRILVRNPRKS